MSSTPSLVILPDGLPVREGRGVVKQDPDASLSRIIWKLDVHALPPALLVCTHLLLSALRTEAALLIAVLLRWNRELLSS